MIFNQIGEYHIECCSELTARLFIYFGFQKHKLIQGFISNQIKRYKNNILSLYSIINGLVKSDKENILFMEGYFPGEGVDVFLNERGLDSELFSEKYWLDKKGFEKKNPDSRNLDWLESISKGIKGVFNAEVWAMVVCTTGCLIVL